MNATRAGASLLALLLLASVAAAQEEPVEAGAAPPPPERGAAAEPTARRFRIGGEVKAHFRSSSEESVALRFPFPPELHPAGPDPGLLAHGRRRRVVRVLGGLARRRGRPGRRGRGQDVGALPRPLQPQPHQLGRPRLRARGLDPHRRQARGAAADAGDFLLRPGRPGAAVLEAAHPAARELRPVGHRRRPLREAAAAAGRQLRAERLLARQHGQRQPAVLPRPERPGRRQRHARARARRRQADLRVGLPDPLRRQGRRT